MELLKVAKIRGPRGLQGEVHVYFFSSPEEWLNRKSALFVGESESNCQKMNLKKISGSGQDYVLGFAEISDRNGSESVAGQFIFSQKSQFTSKKGETIFLSEIIGFQVYDRETSLGPVRSVSSNGPQDLLVLDYEGREVEIPFVEAFIKNIDYVKKIIEMDLPEGLWQLDIE